MRIRHFSYMRCLIEDHHPVFGEMQMNIGPDSRQDGLARSLQR